MRKNLLKRIGRGIFLLGFALVFTQCEGGVNGADNTVVNDTNPYACIAANYPVEALSEAETDALIFMREEEKLAHDVYVKMYDKWGLQVFNNISQSESRHMAAVGNLIDKYGLTDPVGNNAEGVFGNETLAALYNTLINEGLASPVAALKVGAKIEDLDLSDLEEAMAKADNLDIQAVFGELARGSRNHLRAFMTNLENMGATYEPVYLSTAAFEAILAGSMETGPGLCGNCPNQGQGQGNGNCKNRNGRN